MYATEVQAESYVGEAQRRIHKLEHYAQGRYNQMESQMEHQNSLLQANSEAQTELVTSEVLLRDSGT